ncbi:hypothetical protein D5R93_03930 [Actinomyces lilanjuaniae]|uniref:Rv3651-like N-terminal domain-containing protein n=1 Tax=Actinomyces lilanjuaniae TaxID=2321394 RepID=A0ABN5PRR1_9ACTO|nr:hypothetical protein [Actinomyces lilanjuaniae]AYD89420.1 hypothetical protein D5R93_03930 [Actinomyces lilanjuaniae]
MSIPFDVGSWGLFCGQDLRQLVLVDDQPCGPVSARKVSRSLTRRLLLDEGRVARAAQDAKHVREEVSHAGTQWVVRLHPVGSPRSARTVGVLAGVFPAEASIPDLPLVGSWEWEIERDEDGEPTPRRRTYWDRNLFLIYDVDPGAAQQQRGYWEVGEWANELVDQADQMRVNRSIRDGIRDGLPGTAGVYRYLTYHVVTGYGSPVRGRRHLRSVGTAAPVAPNDDKIVLLGLSYEVPETFRDMAFEQDDSAARVDDVLHGVMGLAREPMAVVDAMTLDVLMTSPSWRRERLGYVGGLRGLVDGSPEDLVELHALMAEAVGSTEPTRAVRVRLRRTNGSVQEVSITATGVPGTRHRDVVVRLDS